MTMRLLKTLKSLRKLKRIIKMKASSKKRRRKIEIRKSHRLTSLVLLSLINLKSLAHRIQTKISLLCLLQTKMPLSVNLKTLTWQLSMRATQPLEIRASARKLMRASTKKLQPLRKKSFMALEMIHQTLLSQRRIILAKAIKSLINRLKITRKSLLKSQLTTKS